MGGGFKWLTRPVMQFARRSGKGESEVGMKHEDHAMDFGGGRKVV